MEERKMVEDNAIKAPKSPFAMRENEIKVFDGKDGYASINQVVFKIIPLWASTGSPPPVRR